MAGNPKFLIGEKDGVELGGAAEYIPEAVDITYDDSDVEFSAVNVQEGIDQAGSKAQTALTLPIYTIVLQHNGTISDGTFIGYDSLIDGLSTPVVIPIDSELRAYTFSNSADDADFTINLRKNSSTATIFDTVSKTNTQFFVEDGIAEPFISGDTIFIEYEDDGQNARDAVILLSFRATE